MIFLRFSYGFYLSIKKCSKLCQKSLTYFASFFVDALLQLTSYTLRFCQMKDFIKIYTCGKFHHYSICGCEGKDFWIDLASMKWPLFRDFWVLTSPNIVPSF